ncbi:MAG: hypothetical protein WCY56_03035 [Aminobacteriaceae bacterium]
MTYRNLFGSLCLLFFVVGLKTKSPYAYWGALFAGALSRAAVKKKWKTPPWMEALSTKKEKSQELLDKDEDGL